MKRVAVSRSGGRQALHNRAKRPEQCRNGCNTLPLTRPEGGEGVEGVKGMEGGGIFLFPTPKLAAKCQRFCGRLMEVAP